MALTVGGQKYSRNDRRIQSYKRIRSKQGVQYRNVGERSGGGTAQEAAERNYEANQTTPNDATTLQEANKLAEQEKASQSLAAREGQTLVSDQTIRGTARREGEYLITTRERVKPIASFEPQYTPSSGPGTRGGTVVTTASSPEQTKAPVKNFRKITTKYTKLAEKYAPVVQEEGKALISASQKLRQQSQDKDKYNYVQRLSYGAASDYAKLVGTGTKITADYLRRYGETDPSLGKEFVVAYTGGKVFGVLAGEYSNIAGRTAASRYGPKAGVKAFDVTEKTIGTVGLGATGLSLYGKDAEEIGSEIPSFVVGGYSGYKAYKASKPGVNPIAVESLGSSRPIIRREGIPGRDSFGAFVENKNVAVLSAFGKVERVPFTSYTNVAGGRLGSGKYAVEASTYGSVSYGGKRFPFSNDYSGFMKGRAVSLKETNTGETFTALSERPQLLASDEIGSEIYSLKTKFLSKNKKGEPEYSGLTKTIYQPTEYTSNKLYNFNTPEKPFIKEIIGEKEYTINLEPTLKLYGRPGFYSEGVSASASRKSSYVTRDFDKVSNRLFDTGENLVIEKPPKNIGFKGSRSKRGTLQLLEYDQVSVKEPIRRTSPKADDFVPVDFSGLKITPVVPSSKFLFYPKIGYGNKKITELYSPAKSTPFVVKTPGEKADVISVPSQNQTPKFIFDTGQKSRQAQVTVQDTISSTKNTGINIPAPVIPKIKIPFTPLLPPLQGGGGGSGGDYARASRAGRKKYYASFTGIELGIKSSAKQKRSGGTKGLGLSGLEVRGV